MGSVAAIIPARGGSKGIPSKNITDFCGKPLICHTIDCALKSNSIEDVYVSSDSEEILSIADKFGAIPIIRPDNISGDNEGSESALMHGIQNIDDDYETIVFLQATSPLRSPEHIDTCVTKFFNENADSLFSAVEAYDMCLWSTHNGLNSITYDFLSRKRRQDFSRHIVENGSIYIFNKNKFVECENRICGRVSYEIMPSWTIHEIDSMEDLDMCEIFMRKYIL